jgi:hypothetical protein
MMMMMMMEFKLQLVDVYVRKGQVVTIAFMMNKDKSHTFIKNCMQNANYFKRQCQFVINKYEVVSHNNTHSLLLLRMSNVFL